MEDWLVHTPLVTNASHIPLPTACFPPQGQHLMCLVHWDSRGQRRWVIPPPYILCVQPYLNDDSPRQEVTGLETLLMGRHADRVKSCVCVCGCMQVSMFMVGGGGVYKRLLCGAHHLESIIQVGRRRRALRAQYLKQSVAFSHQQPSCSGVRRSHWSYKNREALVPFQLYCVTVDLTAVSLLEKWLKPVCFIFNVI